MHAEGGKRLNDEWCGMHIDLSGKVAIVTGAGRGSGREIAATLAAEGVTTVATDIRPDLLEDVDREWQERGWAGMGQRCDVRDANEVSRMVGEVVAAYGRIDILV